MRKYRVLRYSQSYPEIYYLRGDFSHPSIEAEEMGVDEPDEILAECDSLEEAKKLYEKLAPNTRAKRDFHGGRNEYCVRFDYYCIAEIDAKIRDDGEEDIVDLGWIRDSREREDIYEKYCEDNGFEEELKKIAASKFPVSDGAYLVVETRDSRDLAVRAAYKDSSEFRERNAGNGVVEKIAKCFSQFCEDHHIFCNQELIDVNLKNNLPAVLVFVGDKLDDLRVVSAIPPKLICQVLRRFDSEVAKRFIACAPKNFDLKAAFAAAIDNPDQRSAYYIVHELANRYRFSSPDELRAALSPEPPDGEYPLAVHAERKGNRKAVSALLEVGDEIDAGILAFPKRALHALAYWAAIGADYETIFQLGEYAGVKFNDRAILDDLAIDDSDKDFASDKDADGRNLLHVFASSRKELEKTENGRETENEVLCSLCIKRLIKGGCSVNDRDNAGYTPVMLAAMKEVAPNRVNVFDLLLEHKPDLSVTNADGKTVWDLASASSLTTLLSREKSPRELTASETFTFTNKTERLYYREDFEGRLLGYSPSGASAKVFISSRENPKVVKWYEVGTDDLNRWLETVAGSPKSLLRFSQDAGNLAKGKVFIPSPTAEKTKDAPRRGSGLSL